MTAIEAIAAADAILPGCAAPEGELDARWQAIILVSEFIESEPEAVWQFAQRWGSTPDEDLRMAIATCIVEHLLDRYPERYQSRAERLARSDRWFADMLSHCWTFDQAPRPSGTLHTMDDAGAKSRRVTVRRYDSNGDADRDDADYWRTLPAAERVLMVWRLSLEQWRLRGEPPYEPGLHRSVARVHRR